MTHGEATSPPTRESCETVPRTKAGIKSTGADQTRALPGEEEGGSCPGGGRWDGARPSRPPMGCKQRSPFPEFQPLLSPSEQELRLLEFIKTRTQCFTPGHGQGRGRRGPEGTVAAPNRR